MRHGHIEDEARADVLDRPDRPRTRIDTLGGEQFFGIDTQIGGGCTFTQDARLRRLTRDRTHNVTPDGGGRLIYLRLNAPVFPSARSEGARLDRRKTRAER
jgi:cellobiose phosphorylase